MKPTESFSLRWQDLVAMSKDKAMITSVKTFDKQVGQVTSEGIIIKEEGINAVDKKQYEMVRLWRFSEIFPKIKTISQRPNVDEMFKEKAILIADRRYPNQKLMTFGNGKYKRPKRSKNENSKALMTQRLAKNKKIEKKKENKMEKLTINQKYKGIKVNRQIARALSATHSVKVQLMDGKQGILQGEYFVEKVKVGNKLLQRMTLIEDCLPQISKFEIKEVVLAQRIKKSDDLLTTGAGWESYYHYLPEPFRNK